MSESDATTLVQSILDAADRAVQQFVFGAWEGIGRSAEPWLTSALLLAVLLFAYGLQMGYVRASRGEVARIVLAVCITYALIHPPLLRPTAEAAEQRYGTSLPAWLYTSVTQVPSAIALQVARVPAGPVRAGQTGLAPLNEVVDRAMERGVQAAGLIYERGGVANLKALAIGTALYGIVLFSTLSIVLALVLSKLGVGVLLGLAPFVSVLYLFAPTRRLVDGYGRQLLSFAITPVLVYALVGMHSVMSARVGEALLTAASATTPSLTFITPYIVVTALVGYLAKQAPGWAGAIASGASLGVPGVDPLRALRFGARAVASTARSLAPYGPGRLPSFARPSTAAASPPMRPTPSWVQAHVRPPERPTLEVSRARPVLGAGPSGPSSTPGPRSLGPGGDPS